MVSPVEAPRGQKTNEKQQDENGVLLFKVKADGEAVPWPYNYKRPQELTLSIGVSRQETKPLRVAFNRSGGSITHAYLESTAAPPGTDYRLVNAYLSKVRRNGERISVLEILILPPEDIQLLEAWGHQYNNPYQVLTDPILTRLVATFGINEYRYVKDTRGSRAIREAQERQANAIPKGGLAYGKWAHQNRSGG